jgi:hypothetical protein
MLPRVKIYFENGALGSVAPSADSVAGLMATAVAVTASGGLQLSKSYLIRSLSDLEALGVTSAVNDANAFLYKHVKEFYAEAGEGAELWIMGLPNTMTPSAMVDPTRDAAKLFVREAEGKLRAVAVAYNPANGYTPTITDGVDGDLFAAMQHAQQLAEWATTTLYAPLLVLLEARSFSGVAADLRDLSTCTYNRVGVLLGDTAAASSGAAVGLLLGRIARIPVQRHIGRVRDNAVSALTAYLGSRPAELADATTANDKGYVTFRTFTGKSGYFFADDSLATAAGDDYRSLARRRTVDKAYRIAYAALLNFLNDEVPITSAGELVPAIAKSWEAEVEAAIINQMTAEGNLGVDPTDAADSGVTCYIDYAQKVAATNKIDVSLKVKPYGYAKYIDVKLGFITINQ